MDVTIWTSIQMLIRATAVLLTVFVLELYTYIKKMLNNKISVSFLPDELILENRVCIYLLFPHQRTTQADRGRSANGHPESFQAGSKYSFGEQWCWILNYVVTESWESRRNQCQRGMRSPLYFFIPAATPSFLKTIADLWSWLTAYVS